LILRRVKKVKWLFDVGIQCCEEGMDREG